MSWFSRNSMSVAEAAAALEGGARLIDVRTASEWKSGRAAGAVHMPPQKLDRQVARLKDETVLVMCRSGSRSARAAAMLRRAGVDAKNVRGGLKSWQRHQLPTTRGGSKR